MLTDGRRRIISNLTVISAMALNWEQKFSRKNRKEKPEPEEKSVPSFSVFFFLLLLLLVIRHLTFSRVSA